MNRGFFAFPRGARHGQDGDGLAEADPQDARREKQGESFSRYEYKYLPNLLKCTKVL